ncbi:MAG: hypothetical protein V2B19_31770 [Pseudomonadota bacterium]
MAKKEETIHDVLARAEKLFHRGNFPLALREFEKLQTELNRDDIAEKIGICRRQADALKVKELIKRGRRADQKGSAQEALRCFEQAYEMGKEQWLGDRIGALRRQMAVQGADAAAAEAESAGDFARAADLYGRAAGAGVANRARCLVKAGRFSEAVDAYKDMDTIDSSGRYHYGFALAQTGRYRQCLQVWEPLETYNDSFFEQKKIICLRYAADLYERMEKECAYAEIYKEVIPLLETTDSVMDARWGQSLLNLREYCRYAAIGSLWDQEAFSAVTDLLDPSPVPMSWTLICLNAKAWFRRAEKDPAFLDPLLVYWLTAVYAADMTPVGSGEGKTADAAAVREKRVETVENLIRVHMDTEPGRKAAAYYKIEKELIWNLSQLADGRAQGTTPRICGPRYAARFGMASEMADLVRANRASFKTTAQYLETGGYYSLAGESLSLLCGREYENAVALLAELPPGARADEFVDYAVNRVHFEFAMHCLDTGDSRFSRYLDAAPVIFDLAPDSEKAFTDKVLAIDDWETLKPYEDALTHIHRKRPSDAVRSALSLVMTRRAIDLYNQDQLTLAALKGITGKALMIYPENEMARGTLNDTLKDLETDAIFKAFDRGKLNKASRMARESEYPEVRDSFFEFVEQSLPLLEKSDLSGDEKAVYLSDLYACASSLGTHHRVLDKLSMMLNLSKKEGAG